MIKPHCSNFRIIMTSFYGNLKASTQGNRNGGKSFVPRSIWAYRNDPKFLDRSAWANSADPDQTAPRGGAVWSGSALFAISVCIVWTHYSMEEPHSSNFRVITTYFWGVQIFRKFTAIWALSWENLFMPYANNKGADQPAHPRSLISAFVVRCLVSIIPLVSISEISSLYLPSVAVQSGLSLPWSQTPKTVFLVTRQGSYNILWAKGHWKDLNQPLSRMWDHYAFMIWLNQFLINACVCRSSSSQGYNWYRLILIANIGHRKDGYHIHALQWLDNHNYQMAFL